MYIYYKEENPAKIPQQPSAPLRWIYMRCSKPIEFDGFKFKAHMRWMRMRWDDHIRYIWDEYIIIWAHG